MHTAERKAWVPADAIIAELECWLEEDGQADVITLAGSGEPTLNTEFGKVLQFLRKQTDFTTVILTNGTLLYLPEVRADAAQAHIVKVTMSVWDEDSFRKLHHPADGISFEKLIHGEQAFRRIFEGELWVEVFVVAGINDSDEAIRRIGSHVATLEPDRIHLNTAVRPPADPNIKPLGAHRMAELARILGPNAEVAARFSSLETADYRVNEDRLLDILKRRPCTAEQLAEGFNMHTTEVSKYLGDLLQKGILSEEERDGMSYFTVRRDPGGQIGS
jgi:wyosine [tRNA(Phe)-imidazoG37] synthetase (radical SAM superfamily)